MKALIFTSLIHCTGGMLHLPLQEFEKNMLCYRYFIEFIAPFVERNWQGRDTLAIFI